MYPVGRRLALRRVIFTITVLLRRVRPVLGLIRARIRNFGERGKRNRWLREPPNKELSTTQIVEQHFSLFSSPSHVALRGFQTALESLAGEPARILETGTSAWGADSTVLWAKYVNSFGGQLISVDIRPEPRQRLGNLGARVELEVDDSVAFIQKYALSSESSPFNLVYLDSFDVDWNNPSLAAEHCWAEWEAIQSLVADGTVVVIDDTPKELSHVSWASSEVQEAVRNPAEVIGKGALVYDFVRENASWEVLHHSYNLVVRKKARLTALDGGR